MSENENDVAVIAEFSDSETEEKPEEVEKKEMQKRLKLLSNQVVKYKRRIAHIEDEEEKADYQKRLEYIKLLRLILKMSKTNQEIVNKVLTFMGLNAQYPELKEKAIKIIEDKKY